MENVNAPSTPRGRKRAIALMTVGLLAAGGGLSFAFWTGGGTGTGSALAGTTVAVVANQTSTVSALGPGGAAQTLTGNFDNPGSGPVYVASVTASIASVTKDAGAVAGTCDATDFTLSGATMAVGAQVPAGTAQGSWTGATLEFNNKPAVNQDACKNATVNLSYAVS